MTLAEKLDAARTRLAVGPVETRGVIRLIGKGARDFLHRMSTQDLAKLPPGGSAYTAFLEVKGHLVGEALVAASGEELLLVTEATEVAPVIGHLRKYVLAAPLKLADASAELACLPVLGPGAADASRAAAGGDAQVTIAATPRRGANAVEVLAPPARASAIRDALVAAGAVPLDEGDLEVRRIAGGVPRFGPDMAGERLPMEAGLSRDAIHFQKGCYIGQEVVTRATFRGQLQKGLVQLDVPSGARPGDRLKAGDDDAGWLTSVADAPEGRIGLGYLRRAHWREGERLATAAGDAVVRKVIVHEPG